MLQSKLFTKTIKDDPRDEISVNAKYLTRGGFVNKEISGVYSYLPLGLRVLNKISNIIREEMDMIGGQELFLTALQDKNVWTKSGRWSDDVVDNWFKTSLKSGAELGLGFTHEEQIANLMKKYISSYKDLPFCAYQIQTKFRNEARAKSGLMRGREFFMKDMYSFSRNKEEHDAFYEKMKDVYMKIFNRIGIGDKTYLTISSGGSFSKYSYEFQTISDAGEDTIYIDKEKRMAVNKEDYNDEIVSDFKLDENKDNLIEKRAIEVGDIYSLAHKFSKALDLKYTTRDGKEEFVYMGSYGMSPSRLMGAIVEVYNDDSGIVWPDEVAPFDVHLIRIKSKNSGDKVDKVADKIYKDLSESGVDVLYDDRDDIAPGAKFADADLIGCPIRLVVSEKTISKNSVEAKRRDDDGVELIKIRKINKVL